jgi:hypothetical protein
VCAQSLKTTSIPLRFFWFAVLDRLDAFLPSLRTANTELAERAAADPLSVNVEHVENEEEEHVEMVRLLC